MSDTTSGRGGVGIRLYVEGGHTNFMVLTRVSDNPVNRTTAWVDQNQT